MSYPQILESYSNASPSLKLRDHISLPNGRCEIKGLMGSALSMVLTNMFESTDKPFLFVLNDKEEAAYYLNDLEKMIGEDHVLFYPGSYRRPYQIEKTDNANILLRAEVLNRINSRKKPAVIVTYPDALFEKVVTKKELDRNTLKISVGDQISIDFANEVLFEYAFKRVDFVTEPGEFSVRGGILDVFSFSNDEPYRIEFFGNEIDSIRIFDVETQLSKDQIKKLSIIPNVENKQSSEKRESFLKYLPSKTVVIARNVEMMYGRIDSLFAKAEQAYSELQGEIKQLEPEDIFSKSALLKEQLAEFNLVELSGNQPDITFKTVPQPSFNKQFELLIDNLKQNEADGYKTYLFCSTAQQAKRFKDIFDDMGANVAYETVIMTLYRGFMDHDLRIACYTDHEIFDRYHKFQLKNGYAKKQAITLKELNTLEKGDYVTHIDHGIGRFGGLQKIDVNGKMQEAIKLFYGERDILYVSIHSLHKITRYSAKDGKTPKIYKLGSPAWKKLKAKTKTRVKQIAFDLIKLYAKRRANKGFQYAPDGYLQNELEASFIYEDTPDQSTATQDVKNDMESERPMDRLVCGDVGFGKTEVAIRAAFKAAVNGKQVAVLVPTTVLAFQHAKTFKERLVDMPVKVDYLNRFRTAKERRAVLDGLADGSIDIVIGTHQLVNKSVKFKDIGLLIIDEEQKFGVAVKDKLKTLKENIDTLTLTATPIPRTLQFSLMAARDLSVIKTAPPNRHPIETQIVRFSEETIRDAISYEISRGGQVFFVHNRIENIKEVAGMIQRSVPDARVGIGHGQMDGKKLEELMLAFMKGEFDVLVSTTIIESGLDVPNANTIFINNANNFGLSDLHQMRGRVGRSNKKAFCYFITPPYDMMTDDARKRMQAIENFSELGSGFNIAMKDLEIRGAGDILGGEQSGFINEIGFDTYQKILSEAIEELKENEFADLYPTDATKKKHVSDVTIDTDFELLFPDDYINSVTERLALYSKLNDIEDQAGLDTFRKELVDRFGELPYPAEDLLTSIKLKWIASRMGLEKIVMKQGKFVGYFIADQTSKFYQSETFNFLIQSMSQRGSKMHMKEKQTRSGLRLLLKMDHITSVDKAFKIMNDVLPLETATVEQE
ncbi:transcription-repair coupling factor [Nonlabens sp. YIK11]|uniref:transcription-repair coupling factor n=1 Tax=Nonlabens sp. YIK11 TaxID=1453349 RepID=UPI0006DC75E0|nr:transcription-repair coupling factor [Nonlabens sp. YIK11]